MKFISIKTLSCLFFIYINTQLLAQYTSVIEYNFCKVQPTKCMYWVKYEKGEIEVMDTKTNDYYLDVVSMNKSTAIETLVQAIQKAPSIVADHQAKSWYIELKINGQVVYHRANIFLKDLPDTITTLLELLIEHSTVKINDKDFS